MDEYIEREAISEEIRKYYYKNPPNSSYGEGFDRGLDRAQRAILDAPAADVEPVRHGRWERDELGSYLRRCSVCKKTPIYKDERGNSAAVYACICINCGARMDGDWNV